MADVPSDRAAGSDLPAPSGSGVQFELLATLDLFGLRADATALFGPGRDAILAVRLGDMRLGDLLRFLVDKAAPGSDFQLTPPWDFLNAVNLHDFTFEVDLTRFRVGFRYDGIGFHIPLITLSAVQVFYSPATADRPKSVDLSLFGSFLGVDYTTDPGLTWDLLTEPAPSAPGQGNKVFDLEYLGLGQHVVLRRPDTLTTIGAVIDALEGAHRTVDRRKNPLSQLPALTFDTTAGWFFATKFSALETVTLSAVFNDPVLYGLRVALDGKRVGKLAGLEFEILYRKISDNLGVFHTELKLPDAVRTIEAGEATITLPIIDVDVYTNGNFLVDLGFPRNLDFSRALSVDVIVFVPVPIPVSAAVGLYFGVLSGATSSQVPQVVNGRFDPVIVAGIGVRVGLGYAISLGPLHADFFAGVIGILEGVLAWFHPDADPTSTSIYYRISGTVGIQIHIEGRVDFAILSASLDIEAYADASAVVESYQPIHLTFEAGVSISLSVKVLFFHITLSFSASVRESITIGSATPTPWMLGAPQAGAPVARTAAFADVAALGISWHDRAELVSPVAAGGLVVEVHLQPMLTAGLVGDRPGEEPTGAVAPQIVAALFVADHGQMEGTLAVANRAVIIGLAAGPGVGASDAELAGFGMDNAGVAGLLQAGTHLAVPDATVTADGGPLVVGPGDTFATLARRLLSPFERLAREALLWAVESADLSLRAVADDPIVAPLDADSLVSAEHLRALHADLTTRQLPLARVVDFLTTRGIVLDVRPLPAASPRNPSFTVFPMPPFVSMTVDGATVDFSSGPHLVGADYRALLATYFQDLAGGAAPRPLAPDGGPDESVAAVLFAECFALLLRQLVQDTLEQFQLYPGKAAPGETLDEIADRFALTTAAPAADATASDAAVVRIGRANQTSEAFFAPGARLAIRDRSARVGAGDTLLALGGRLGTSPLTVAGAVRDRAGVLDVGSVLTIAGGHVTVVEGDTLAGIAARLAVPLDVVVGAAADVARLLAPLTVIPLPTGPYLVSPGDTLGGIAQRYQLSLAEVGQAAAAVDGLLVVGSVFALPPLPYAASDAESLAAVVARFETTLGELVGANPDTQALRPGTVVVLGLPTQVRGGDSLGSLAARFGLAPAELVRAVDDVPGLLVPGATVVLPSGATGTVAPNDTLAAVAGRAGLASVDLVAGGANLDDTNLLTPLAAVRLPEFTYAATAEDTPLSVARRFGLTVEQLVLANRDVGFDTVVVPDAQQLPLGVLVEKLAMAGAFDASAGTLARFLLHGLRLPAPGATTAGTPDDRATLPLYPLYTLTGQQVTPPSTLAADYGITLSAAASHPVIGFGGGGDALNVRLSDEDRAMLAAIAAQLAKRPPIDDTPLAAGPYPTTVVAPRRYALGKPVPWQTPYPPRLTQNAAAPAPGAAPPCLYPFPDALRVQVAATAGPDPGPGLLVDLVSGVEAAPTSPADLQPITGFGWGTRIDFGVRRAPDPTRPGAFLPTVFEVFGTDAGAVDDLTLLLTHLDRAADSPVLALLYPADAQPGAAAGLRSDQVAPADIVLLKANLSTRSRPPMTALAAAESPAPPVAASTADPHGFLTLLWEATVTNTGGYYLSYGGGLPPEIFNQDPTATLSLLVTLHPHLDATSTIALRPLHNTAVVVEPPVDPNAAVLAAPRRYRTSAGGSTLRAAADALGGPTVADLGAANAETRNLLAPNARVTVEGIDHQVVPGDTIGGVARALGTSVADVVAALADTPLNPGAAVEAYASWLVHRGTLRAGAAGFRVVRADPDPDTTGQDDAATKLAVLFNLVGYRLADDAASGFVASADGLPIGPAQPTSGPLNHELTAVAGTEPWIYQKQVRVDRFARSGAVVLGDLQDPYAGVGSTARFGWQYQDVFGNRLSAPAALDVPVRYTDELAALSQWPAILHGYRIVGTAEAASVEVLLMLDASVYAASPGELFAPVGLSGFGGVAARATAHRDRYGEIFWQLSHDVAVEVATTVDGGAPHPMPPEALAGFAAATWSYLQTVVGLIQLTIPVPENATLADIAAAYHVPVAELALVNRSTALNADAANLLTTGATVVVETRYSVLQNDTLAHIAAQAPPHAPDPGQVAATNPGLALQVGRLLTPGVLHPVTAADTLKGVAAANGLDPAQLGAANAQRDGLLVPDTALTLSGATYRIAPHDTLASIATATRLAVVDVVAAVAAAGGPLTTGADIVVPVAVAATAEATLAGLAGRFGVTAADLAHADATVDVLRPGAVVALPGGGEHSVAPGDTLASIAAAHQVDVGVLAEVNSDAPGLMQVGARLTSPYRVQAGDTLASVAAAFGLSPAVLGTVNAQVAGLVAAEQSVLLATTDQPVETGDTLASLAAAAGTTVAALATANAWTAGLLVKGVPIALPRHVRVPAADAHTHTTADGETLAGIAGDRIDVVLLGAANADVDGLLAPAATLSFTPEGGRTYQEVTQANDTLSTVALRLQAALASDGLKRHLTAGLLAEANGGVACLAANRLLLVPPATLTLAVPVTEANPKALFPLETTLTLRRTANVEPALADNPDVAAVTTPVAPFLPEGAAGRSVALRTFAEVFEAAFTDPRLKLTTTGSTAGTGTPGFVAVQYGPGTALDIAVGASTPYFFAPRPLAARPDATGAYVTALWSAPGSIPIHGYTRGQGLAAETQQMSFKGVDLDVWGRQLLAVLDLVLSADYAAAAYRLDADAYASLVAAKEQLAGAIRDSVTQVTAPGTAPPADLAAAREALYQRLLTRLSEAYEVDAVVAVPVAVTAPPDWTGDTAPRLHGQPVGTVASVPVEQQKVTPGDTLTSLAERSTVWAVGADNAELVGLLAPDVTLRLSDALGYHTVSGDTLASIADARDLPLAAVVAAAADVPLLLVPDVVVTVCTATLRTLADGLDAPLPLVVDALADMAAILRIGAEVERPTGSAGPPSTTTTAGDTLATVAARLGVSAADLGAALADTPGLLQPGAGVNLIVRTSTVEAADTPRRVLGRLALDLASGEALAAAVADFAAMNVDLRGLLAKGTSIPAPDPGTPPYTVGERDRLRDVADRLGPGASPSEILTALLDVQDAFTAHTTVRYLSRMPGFTLSDAEVPLVDSTANPDASTALTFLLHTASNIAFDSVSLDVEFQVNQLEYDIAPVPWATGYRSSHWLTFLVPPQVNTVGRIDVPIALRAFPVPPNVIGQRIVAAAVPSSPTLQDLRRYAYDYTFDLTQAAQDRVTTGYTLNTPPGTEVIPATGDGGVGLGGSLAQFASVRPLLELDLSLIPAVDPLLSAADVVAANPGAAAALVALARVATQIAEDWTQWVHPTAPNTVAEPARPRHGSAPRHDIRFDLHRGATATGEPTVTLRPRGPVAARVADEPRVALAGHVAGDGHSRAGLTPVSFTPDAATTTTEPLPGLDRFTLSLSDRDVVTAQNIWGRVSLTRNTDLLAGVPTESAFVYTVPDARMPAPATPLLSAADAFDLTTVPFAPPDTDPGPTERRPLVAWLANFFDSLLNRFAVLPGDTLPKIADRHGIELAELASAVADVPGLVALTPTTLVRPVANARYLRVSVDYGFAVATAAGTDPLAQQEIVSRLPVFLRPTFLFDSAVDLIADNGFCADLAERLTAWAADRGLPDDVGMWVLDVSLYTTVTDARSVPESVPPLLQLRDVRLRRDRIAPTPARTTPEETS